MTDLPTLVSASAALGLTLAAAVGVSRRPRRAGSVPGPTPRNLRRDPRRRGEAPQPEVQQRPGWGAGSALPPDAITLES